MQICATPLALVTIAGLCLAMAGCATDPGSQSHAHVQIEGKTVPEIQQVARAVFAEEGYSTKVAQPDLMVFDRMGSSRDALKWGGLATGDAVTMRVKVQFTMMNTTTTLLQADAFAVHGADQGVFESEDRNVMLNHRPYQKLLDEVRKRSSGK